MMTVFIFGLRTRMFSISAGVTGPEKGNCGSNEGISGMTLLPARARAFHTERWQFMATRTSEPGLLIAEAHTAARIMAVAPPTEQYAFSLCQRAAAASSKSLRRPEGEWRLSNPLISVMSRLKMSEMTSLLRLCPGICIGSGSVPRYILSAAPKRSLSYFIEKSPYLKRTLPLN